MKWTIEYKKNNGEDQIAETYYSCTVLGDYSNNRGLLVKVPERETKRDTGIRKMNYDGIVSMILA